MSAGPILKVENVYKTYRGKSVRALEPVSFTLFPGETLGITGRSGSGKSTLLRLIAGLEMPDGGTIYIDGEALGRARCKERRKDLRKVQLVFQDPVGSFDPKRPMGTAILDAMRYLCPEMSAEKRRERLGTLLERVGLPAELSEKKPHEVSGGQCQRMALVRALASGPRLLLCDEITSALDTVAQASLLELLDSLRREQELAILFVCHDPALTEAFCHGTIPIGPN